MGIDNGKRGEKREKLSIQEEEKENKDLLTLGLYSNAN
jgi:hypothetical protein